MIVFEITGMDTFQNIASNWLPEIEVSHLLMY